jgi:hypothetical protein
MLSAEDRPYVDMIEDWFKCIGYAPMFYQSHTPVRGQGPVKRLTQRERELVDSLSKERGYRRFHAIATVI